MCAFSYHLIFIFLYTFVAVASILCCSVCFVCLIRFFREICLGHVRTFVLLS